MKETGRKDAQSEKQTELQRREKEGFKNEGGSVETDVSQRFFHCHCQTLFTEMKNLSIQH